MTILKAENKTQEFVLKVGGSTTTDLIEDAVANKAKVIPKPILLA